MRGHCRNWQFRVGFGLEVSQAWDCTERLLFASSVSLVSCVDSEAQVVHLSDGHNDMDIITVMENNNNHPHQPGTQASARQGADGEPSVLGA